MRYYCDNTINSNEKWQYLLSLVVTECDHVAFNVLQKNFESVLEKDLINEAETLNYKKNEKIYSSGKQLLFPLNEKVLKFINSKEYNEWKNFCIEDPSFMKDGKEILATITHENYIIMLLSEKQRVMLNSKGFEFKIKWNP